MVTARSARSGGPRRIGRLTVVVLVLLGTAVLMTLFELVKTLAVPRITLWQSHTVTIAFASLCATAMAYVVLYRIEGLVAERGLAAARESEAHFRRLSDAAFEGIGIVDQGRIVDMNGRLVELLGYAVDELAGMPVDRLVAPEDRALVEAHMRSGSTERYEHRVVRRDGSTLMVEVQGRPYFHDGRTLRVTAIRDITERLELEEQLRHAQKMEAVGRLAGGVAHDFNNLLLVIGMHCQILLDDLPPDDPRREEVEVIARAGERAAALTRQLLAFSRRQVLDPRVLDLNAVVAGAEQMLRRLVEGPISVVARLDPALGAIRADVGQLEQVLLNLAVNARDAMPSGGTLTLETTNVEVAGSTRRVEQGVLPPGRYAVLRVSDTGIGMDAETRSHVFEPFFTTKPKGKGTGLGLSTVYGIVRQSDGYVAVESAPGRGTTFEIYLPRVSGAAAETETAPADAVGPAIGGTILVVEDEAAVLDVVCESLRRDGYRVLPARDAESAQKMAKRETSIALLITDIVLPGLDGRVLADRLTARRPDLDVLFISGYADDALLPHGALAAGLQFLQKPFTADALRRKVRDILAPPAPSQG